MICQVLNLCRDDLRVGDTIWIFDADFREYHKDKDGKSYGGPIYRSHWREETIIGETSKSWLVVGLLPSSPRRIPKAGPLPTDVCLSLEQVERVCWVHDNRRELVFRVQSCPDYQTLKAIEDLLGTGQHAT